VMGLCKVVTRAEVEAADWSLTPGRYVGVAAVEEDEDFVFDEAMQEIRVDIANLNRTATELAARIDQHLGSLAA